LREAKPGWVDKGAREKYPGRRRFDAVNGYPDLSETADFVPLRGAFKNFHKMTPAEYPSGTVLYRIVDPGPKSYDNGVWWMTKAEFDKLKNRDEWRRKFAVWGGWNKNGEFVTYTVPPGKALRGWEGEAASQVHTSREFVLEGGARQIALDPRELDKSFIGKRQRTNWGYGSYSEPNSLVGVPVLTNNWKE
jgi:hypothetical protein